ncbi:MAG: thermonuclease family protein [Candidatus Flexifilum sp.]|jgi:endonuclease YncB( thermonuclease family)
MIRSLRSLFTALLIAAGLGLLTACTLDAASTGGGAGQNGQSGGSLLVYQAPSSRGETGVVTSVIDGDTIEVRIGDVGYRVRYIGVNTPERDEVCYQDAVDANRALVAGQTVTLTRDQSNTDRYGRLLRFVYVGDLFVNATLVNQGYAEAVVYNPDTTLASYFQNLERGAAAANRGCHPTGIFNDGSNTR